MSGFVLIVEPDDAVRKFMGAVLRRAGFRSRAVRDLDTAKRLMERIAGAVIVRDLVTGPIAPAELQSRTVIVTAAADTSQSIDATSCFAILRKPCDISQLVQVVRACADRTSAANVLQRFTIDVPTLRRVLAAPPASPRELLLRTEMRRVVGELSDVFRDAAAIEPSSTRAAAFHAAARLAADLAASHRAVIRSGH